MQVRHVKLTSTNRLTFLNVNKSRTQKNENNFESARATLNFVCNKDTKMAFKCLELLIFSLSILNIWHLCMCSILRFCVVVMSNA